MSERFTVTKSANLTSLGTDKNYGTTQYTDETARLQDDAFYGKFNVAEKVNNNI